MRALDLFKDLLRELDKYETPDIDPGDFNYWITSGVDRYINENYAKGDVEQKDLDDIRILLSDPNTPFTQDTVDKTKFSLPGDYLHMLDVEVSAKALSNYRRWKLNQVQRFEARRERTNRKGVGIRNNYDKPSEDNVKYRIVGENLFILVGDKFEPTAAKCWYIKKPQPIVLGPKGSDYNDPAYNSIIEFPDYVAREIVKTTKVLILENLESRRLETSIALEQLEKK